MEKTVKQRLVEYLKFKRIGQNKFESMACISNGYISNLKSAPGAIILTKILNAAPDLNRTWLLTGDGNMLNDTQEVHPSPEKTIDEMPYTKNSNGIKFFKRSDGKLLLEAPKVSRNALGSLDDEFAEYSSDHEDGETELFEVNEVHHGQYYSFEVDGDSMDDDTVRGFQRGDTVLVRELRKDLWLPKLHINKWKFWVVVFGNNVRLKQIVAQDEEAGTITLHSLNPSPEYTDFTLNLKDVDRLFNVVLKKPKTQNYENF